MRTLCTVLASLLVSLGLSLSPAWADPFRVQDGTLRGDVNGGAVLNWNGGIPSDAFGGLGLSSGAFTIEGDLQP
jgi:hypothetical protein